MDSSTYVNLKTVKERVSKKKELNDSIKKDLINAINAVHTIDDITNLLDYKTSNKGNLSEILDKTELLRKIQYKSLNKKYTPATKLQGRIAIFNEDPTDIVSKFRNHAIKKYRTAALDTTMDPTDKLKSVMWDEITKLWKKSMLDWVEKRDDRLSNDEKKIKDIKFNLKERDNNMPPSEFSKQVLDSLNNDGDSQLNMIKYTDGSITEAAKTVIVIDLSNN